MKTSLFKAAAALLLLILFSKNLVAGPISVVDDLNNPVTLTAASLRVVSLSPHLTELIFQIGAEDKLLGTVSHSNYPDAAKKIARIGDYQALNIEKITALDPDLILAWHSGYNNRQINRLAKMGFNIYYSEPEKLSDIGKNIRNIGTLLGRKQQAAELARQFDGFLQEKLSNKNAAKDRNAIKVFYQSWHDPLFTIGGDQIISEAIALCGGINIYEDLTIKAPQVNKESVLSRKPDLIILDESARKEDWLQFKKTNAFKIKKIKTTHLVRPNLSMAKGIEELCRVIAEIKVD